MSDPHAPSSAFFRIEKGNPDAAELAALTAVLLARGAADAEAPVERPRVAAGWSGPARPAAHHLPRSWRTAA
ncbi:acyl-CoA carboxylase epsilon subunit [Streptomyces regalis]|uniref:Acyl-CoA carboxylase subunit epsilon n=1 Tax=Streptomyces regalis TaxID=68262 RepID=A0A101JQ72_9ACTN|nr:acyl-CoA carboxylase epsilon subunit [Streptomyces regalis]KUL31153.1 hypothetical protein ADL12_25585 [Streptomyces regalis]